MTRNRDVADTQDNLGGAVAPYVAAKNGVINGGFDIWQRGTTGTIISAIGYPSADRWNAWTLSAGGSVTLSRQTTSDTTNLPFIQYCGRFQRVAANTSTSLLLLGQTFETINSIPFAGKTITFSFYARKGADFSAASSNIGVELWQTATTDTSLNGMLGVKTNVIGTSAILTTTWQRFSFTGSVASTTTQLAPTFNFTGVGTAGTNDYFEVTGVQVEIGAVATPFARAGGSIGGELALCQRYYETNYPTGVNPGSNMSTAGSYDFAGITLFCNVPPTGTAGTNRARSAVRAFVVPKRINPSVQFWDFVGNLTKFSAGNNDGSRINDNVSCDAFGGTITTDKSISFQTVSASSSQIYNGIMWAVSAEL